MRILSLIYGILSLIYGNYYYYYFMDTFIINKNHFCIKKINFVLKNKFCFKKLILS